MKLIIDIDKEEYERFKKNQKKEYSESMLDVNIIANGTPIPDNATNGDVIKAMFDIKAIDMSNTYCVRFPKEEEDCPHYFFKDWWNAPYKAESNEISERNMKMWEEIFKAERGDKE